eukprot:gene15810-biopygen5860
MRWGGDGHTWHAGAPIGHCLPQRRWSLAPTPGTRRPRASHGRLRSSPPTQAIATSPEVRSDPSAAGSERGSQSDMPEEAPGGARAHPRSGLRREGRGGLTERSHAAARRSLSGKRGQPPRALRRMGAARGPAVVQRGVRGGRGAATARRGMGRWVSPGIPKSYWCAAHYGSGISDSGSDVLYLESAMPLPPGKAVTVPATHSAGGDG